MTKDQAYFVEPRQTEEVMKNGFLLGVYRELESAVENMGVPTRDGDLTDQEMFGFLLADIAVSLRKLSERVLEEDPYKLGEDR